MSNRRKSVIERRSQQYRNAGEKIRPLPTRKPNGDFARTADFNLPYGPLNQGHASRSHFSGTGAPIMETELHKSGQWRVVSVVRAQEHKPGKGSWLRRAWIKSLHALTVKQLRVQAAALGLDTTTRMKKADLIDLIAGAR